MRLSDTPQGCSVEMSEMAAEGPLKAVPDRLQLTGIRPHNKECTWRLANLAEERDPDEFE